MLAPLNGLAEPVSGFPAALSEGGEPAWIPLARQRTARDGV